MTTRTTDSTDLPVKVLTFVIADIRGYSRFSREHGDAAAAILAQRFADLARDSVEARGGEVIELRGDEAFAVFSSPRQAVRAAVEFQLTCAEETAADPELPLLVGIGIDTGPAVPVEDGYRGIAINLAARLCSSAGAGQVMLTDTTAQLIGDTSHDLSLTARGTSSFKGFEEPVAVVEATAVERPAPAQVVTARSARAPLPPELDETTPLAGRVHETRWLRGTWRHVRRGYGRVVVVSGPSGMGKTRLAAELASQVDSAGGVVRYVGPGGTATASALAALREAAAGAVPTLLVLDDVDVLGPAVLTAIGDSWQRVAERPVMVALLMRDPSARPELTAISDQADADSDGRRTLAPLGADSIHDIVEMYAGESIDDAPVESIIRASQGVPGLVHELASEWARSEATRRLEAAAEFIAAGRDRRNADLTFANNVIGLKLGRLYLAGDGERPDGEIGTDTCPYKGLAAFDEDDSSSFFGRERLVGELAARTVASGALAVIGASGSGKSSVIGAGLVPSLRAGLLPGSARWAHVAMRPGQHPMQALRGALGSIGSAADEDVLGAAIAAVPADGRLVLVIDQFEETFTICESEAERETFLSALTGAAARHADRFVVVVALRSDFYGYLAPYPDTAELFADNHVLVAPLTRGELHRAIELPARRTGTRMEAALIDALVDDAVDQPGALPLLSTSLVELWQARDRGWIRMAAYDEGGGIHGAVARLAEASYEALDESDRSAARRVLLRLASTDESGAVTRRRVTLDEFDLARDVAASTVIARFTQDRLLTTSDDTVEVAHEALLREWPRLRQWLDDDVAGRQLHHQLTIAARGWNADDREASELYRGARLTAALDWSSQHGGDLNALEREFLTSSRSAADHEAEAARRTNRRLRSLLSGVAVLLVLALIAGVIAIAQRSSAKHETNVALQQRSSAKHSATVAVGDSLGAEAVSQPRLDLAMLLARQGVAFDPSVRAQANLLTTLLRSPSVLRVYGENTSRLNGIAASPDGKLIALLDNNDNIEVEDAASGRHLRHVTTIGAGVEFGPDGSLLIPTATGAQPVGLRELDPRTGAVRSTLRIPSRYAGDIATRLAYPTVSFDGTGRKVALGYLNVDPDKPGYVLQLSYPSGRVIGSALRFGSGKVGPQGTPPQAFYNSAGTRLVRVMATQTLVYDARTARLLRTYPFGGATYAVSPDGNTVAFINPQQTISFLDLRTGHDVVGTGLSGSTRDDALAFSPNSKTLATGGDSGADNLWDVKTHSVTKTLTGQSNRIFAQTFSPDSATLYTASFDSTAIAWDLTGKRGFVPTVEAAPTLNVGDFNLAISPDSTTIAVGSTDGKVHLWDTETMHQIRVFHAAPAAISALSFGPDGKTLLVVAVRYTPNYDRVRRSYLRLWNVGAGVPTLVRSLPVPLHVVDWATFSPDGSRIAAAGLLPQQAALDRKWSEANPNVPTAGAVVEWDTASGRLVAPPTIVSKGLPIHVVFAPQGDRVAASGFAGIIALIDPVHRRIVRETQLSQFIWDAAFSPDGSRIAAGDWDGEVDLFNGRTGRLQRRVQVGQSPIPTIDWHGNLIATVDQLHAVRLLDDSTFREVGDTFTPPYDGVDTTPYAHFTPNGDSLDITDGTGRVWILPVSLTTWERDACRIAGRSFTQAEWSQFATGQPYRPGCTAPGATP